MKRKINILFGLTVLILFAPLFFPMNARSADFPTKPITLICPWPPGGATDVFLRVFAESAGKYLGQPVVVENKPGGGGTVGPAAMAATAKADGYTVAQISLPVFRYQHMMKVDYDALKDFTYIVGLTGYIFGVVVKADAPWKTFEELIAFAKANPGKIIYGSPGTGTTQNITMERIALAKGIKWTHVPMKGTGENMPALLGGHINVAADSTGFAPYVDSGEMRLLVTFGQGRTKKWPNTPTLKELGINVVADSPFGLAGPKGMDPTVVKKLHDAFKKALDDPETDKILNKLDMVYLYKNTEEYNKQVRALFEEEKELVEKLGLKKN
jgi:tripartite-type tricarboxylate transporter receptor subunit TctC